VDDRPESLSGLRVQLELRGHRVDSVEGVLYAMWAVNASHRVYDLVIYVAPPVLGSEDADAVTGLVDDVVVLVGADASSVELGHAGDLLAGAPVAIVATASR